MTRSIAVVHPGAAPALGEPQSLVVLVDKTGIVHALSTDVEKAADLIPGHFLTPANFDVHEGVPLGYPVQIGQPFTAPA